VSEENENSTFTATLKAAAGYDAPWLVIRADTEEEALAALQAARQTLLQDIAETADLFAAAYRAVKGLNAPETREAIANSQAAAGATPSQPAAGSGKFCEHGPRVERSGVSSKGAWTGYFCPLPKGSPNQCKAQFA